MRTPFSIRQRTELHEEDVQSKLGKTLKSGYWLVKSSQKIGFEIRKYACSEARFICITYWRIYHLFTFVRKYIFSI